MSNLARIIAAAALALVLGSACSDDESSPTPAEKDEIDTPETQICDDELLQAVLEPQTSVSDGSVATAPGAAESTFESIVDVPWDGAGSAWTYVRLLEGSAVPISDVEAAQSTLWDMAIRGPVVRLNGGVSGPGEVAGLALPDADFQDVDDSTEVGTLQTDAIAESCALPSEIDGLLRTAIGQWWTSDSSATAPVPGASVYVIRRLDGDLIKLRFTDFEVNGDRAALTMEWGPLDTAPACDEEAAITSALGPRTPVDRGTVEATTDAGVTTAVVDAAAGGYSSAHLHSFVYVDLDTGTKVEISDVDSFGNEVWDLALKRTEVKINGGDSGPSTVRVAVVEADAIEDVTTVPADGEFATDDFIDEACELVPNALGGPLTAMGEWYDYDVNGHGVITRPLVYVIETSESATLKLEFEDFADGVITLRWAEM